MRSIRKILKDITILTTNIETNYPELYHFLNENPMTIPSYNHPVVDAEVLSEYLESLNELLRHHLETHKNK